MTAAPFALLALLPLVASAQCDPGPATGGGINRCYDDGYVYVDSSGNALDYTTYWGYERASQIQGGSIVFHNRTKLDANTVLVVTDTYDLGFIIPPSAPYAGGFDRPGPVIHDAPLSRSTNVFTITEPPKLTPEQLTFQPGVSVTLNLTVQVGVRVVVEGTTDLVRWDTLADTVTSSSSVNVQDVAAATAHSRFYRIKYFAP